MQKVRSPLLAFCASVAQAGTLHVLIGPPSLGQGGSNPVSIPPVNPVDWQVSYVNDAQREWVASVVPGLLYGQRFYKDGLYAALGTITALLGRERGGPARAVDVAVLDALVVALGPALTTQATTGVTLPRYGNRDPYAAPANRFPTADGYIYVHAGTPGLFARFAKLLGKPELLDDERFRTVEARLANPDYKVEIVVTAAVA